MSVPMKVMLSAKTVNFVFYSHFSKNENRLKLAQANQWNFYYVAL